VSDVVDLGTDDGLRAALGEVLAAGTWDGLIGERLLDEIRNRAVRHASHVGAVTRERCDRSLVDDLVCAAWAVLDRHARQVIAVARPWAYLMSAARRRVLGEIRAHRQLVSASSSERAAAGGYAPQVVVRVGSSVTDLASAFRHEHAKDAGARGRGDVVPLSGRRHADRLSEPAREPSRAPMERAPWYAAFIRLLVDHGADEIVTTLAVDHLANLFTHTKRKLWETTARRDPVLARLGLSPDQCGALVALLAGSRRERAAGEVDSLLAAVRVADAGGVPVELSVAQRRRVAVYVGDAAQPAAAYPADVKCSEAAGAASALVLAS
jgi:hypothetical protein